MMDRSHPFERALIALDMSASSMGHPCLTDADLGWMTRCQEVCTRVWGALNPDSPPDVATLAAAGAHLLALYRAAVKATDLRVDAGDAA